MEFYIALITIIIIVILIALTSYFARWMYKNERMSKGVAKTYERFANGATYMKNKHWTLANDLYEKTSGYTYDKTADLALKKTLKREEMHAINEVNGVLSPTNMADAMNTAYILGNLYNYNVPNAVSGDRIGTDAAAATADFYFNRALSRIITNPDATIATHHGRPTAEDVIDRAQDFFERPQITGGAVAVTTRPTQQAVFDFGRIRGAVRAARVAVAAKRVPKDSILPPKMAAVENYYENRPVPNDPQNVHDSEFVDEMGGLFKKLAATNAGGTISHGQRPAGHINFGESVSRPNNKSKTIGNDDALLAEISDAIGHTINDPNRKNRALQILDRMKQGAEITSLGTNERQVLLETWKRTHAIENETVPDKVAELRSSIVDALADSMESRELGTWQEVCVTGRCSRVLGALTLLDANEQLAAPLKTKAILRKEIMEHAYKTINDAVSAADSTIAEQYQGLKPITDQAAMAALEQDLRTKIEQSIRENYPHVNSRTLEPLIQDAQAGI